MTTRHERQLKLFETLNASYEPFNRKLEDLAVQELEEQARLEVGREVLAFLESRRSG